MRRMRRTWRMIMWALAALGVALLVGFSIGGGFALIATALS